MYNRCKKIFKSIASISLVAMLFSCTNNSNEVRDFFASKNLPIGVTKEMHHIYKDSGKLTSRLITPLLKDLAIEKELIKLINKSVFSKAPISSIDNKALFKFLEHTDAKIIDEVCNQAIDLEFIDSETEQDKYIIELKGILLKKEFSEQEQRKLSYLQKIYIKTQFRTYLNDDLLEKAGLSKHEPIKKRKVAFLTFQILINRHF